MEKDGFVIYKSFYKPISKLSDNQLGRLFRALFEYNINGNIVVDEDIEMAFEFFRNQLEIDNAKYLKMVEKNRENGRRGGNQKAENKKGKRKDSSESSDRYPTLATATQRYPNLANLADKDKDKDKDKDYNTPLPPNEGDDEFERFWNLYDKKRGKAKVEAKFKKLSQADKAKIFETLPKYVESTPDVKYRKDPLTYLNGECWNDEIINDNAKQTQTPSNRQPVKDLSQYRDPTRHYETITDF